MADRYFVDAPITGQEARLVGQEAHHLAHVMRAKAGQPTTLFDGSGAEFSATITRVGRSEIELHVEARHEVDRELAVAITLGVALPKGDRQKWLVEKATELGVARLVPLVTERSNDRESPAALDKLRRAVIEASKQCGRNRLMEIAPPTPAAEFFGAVEFSTTDVSQLRLIAHPGGAKVELSVEGTKSVAIAVGPEGGFTDAELDAALESNWQAVDLGTRILRIETAAVAFIARIALT
jgi:16S rRNA (uracil1498-N3)-methyltransferase